MDSTVLRINSLNSSALSLGLALRLWSMVSSVPWDKIILHPTVISNTSTGNIKDGGLEGTPQLFRIPHSTQTPQNPTQPVCKLISYPLILELANIQPRLRWYHSPSPWVKLKLQLLQQAFGQYWGTEHSGIPCSSGSSFSDHQQAHGLSLLPLGMRNRRQLVFVQRQMCELC